jgi:hypothetical protein
LDQVIEAFRARWMQTNGQPVEERHVRMMRDKDQALYHAQNAGITAEQVADDFARLLGLKRRNMP